MSTLSDNERLLVRAGSVAAAAREIGEAAASEALYTLTEQAPEEMRASWPLVLSWGRMQAAFEIAEALGDADQMVKIAKEQASLLKGLY